MPAPPFADLLLTLSRLQFALTAAFHMTFPAVTVGLSVLLAFSYWKYMRTGEQVYLQMFRFWRKIFAVGFALGVVAGIVLTFEFGLNWAPFAHATGPIVGPIIGMEVVTAFFLEAGFLGILLYGDGRVRPRVMFFATCMVAVGTLLSTTWIIAANSWLQTPAGYRVVEGQFQPADWASVIFNPSFLWRFSHMLIAVLISASWMIAGISAYYLLKGRDVAFARRTLSIGLGVIAMLIPVQLYVGDEVAFLMLEHQPAKLIAFEGNWTSDNTGYNLFVVPDDGGQRNVVQVRVPWLGSAIAKDLSGNTPIPGLSSVPAAARPQMAPPFFGFRLMFYAALVMFFVSSAGLLLRWRGRLYTSRRFLRIVLWCLPVGVLAVIGGWVTAETGRQPWVVFGLLRTRDAVSPLAPGTVIASVVGFVLIYAAMFACYVAAVARFVRRGPDHPDVALVVRQAAQPSATPVVEGA